MQLDTAEWVYLVAVGLHLFFFGLFLRLLWWKRYADVTYWRHRPELSLDRLVKQAQSMGQALPRFSLIVPARNEADVIERTVDHLAGLTYPHDLYEVLVVTDAKEEQAAAQRRSTAVADAVAALRERRMPAPDSTAGGLVMALIAGMALDGIGEAARRLGPDEGIQHLRRIPAPLLRPIIWEAALRLLRKGAGSPEYRLLRTLRSRLPDLGQEPLQRAYAALLSLAIPCAVAFASLRGEDGAALGRRLATLAAQAHHSLTRELIQSLCSALAADLMVRLERLAADPLLAERLAAAYREVYPTTQDIMARKVAEYAARPAAPAVRHVVVPVDFDGQLNGRCLGVTVPSTKGRALNWALRFIDGRSTWCGFYDAESRPDSRVMLYLAHRVLEARRTDTPLPRIFQGPVFQVRNWYDMGAFCKLASLFTAISHEWHLPVVYRSIPFVGGTNVFVETRLLHEIGGFDSSTLTEDLELGTRAWLKARAWPEYLPYPSSEQTPPTFMGFYRQRLRWASGHLQVMRKIRAEQLGTREQRQRLLRSLWFKGQAQWLFYQAATLVPLTVFILWTMGLVDPTVVPPVWRYGLHMMSALYIAFAVYLLLRYLRYVDPTSRPLMWLGQLGAVGQILVLPLAGFLFPVPYFSALVLAAAGKGPSHWVKTPRTRE
ncbi:cellulose synthase/poly-beta-1,6-N-acetylglucosamine synthase-like glycosyltransferase [Symbiobacterium terraclitae]|uniref:Cellulose synthase/poly-beta-1,6-N-acetylglucosamine synthase-like glycosyltransferase n=1 Tax=Symbiobacterium terraclitae TaxID=557451 RepID=A0ABS4JMU9_9FIRM|nr:glycosyltransferase [Symbiobacterium terraclitae]MBP2016867.1 cellulose synthase/poly-beta-1,6-N-acetylglucosamine synthase-like glycosyltransferase [Symbiobacterium terraclitae]